jgi:hypothetical protein
MSEQHYDVIGDVHGHADALPRLLVELGYRESGGASDMTTEKRYLWVTSLIAVPTSGTF